eukprot:m.1614192 g.1614192  ORF g.1614192 m.1614192 type:complete len:57 (+) comp25370_c0_seq11:3236-3406(+)
MEFEEVSFVYDSACAAQSVRSDGGRNADGLCSAAMHAHAHGVWVLVTMFFSTSMLL